MAFGARMNRLQALQHSLSRVLNDAGHLCLATAAGSGRDGAKPFSYLAQFRIGAKPFSSLSPVTAPRGAQRSPRSPAQRSEGCAQGTHLLTTMQPPKKAVLKLNLLSFHFNAFALSADCLRTSFPRELSCPRPQRCGSFSILLPLWGLTY